MVVFIVSIVSKNLLSLLMLGFRGDVGVWWRIVHKTYTE